MPNSDYSRNEYLKALLNASKNNRANEGVLVNPSNTLGNANTDISELAVLDTKLPSKNKVPTTEQIKDTDNRNWWQRTMDSINEFRLNVLEGTFNFFGGIVDAGLWLGGAISDGLGGSNQWAQNAMDYDWESQVMNFMNQTNYGQHIYSGDIFQKDYWQNWADMGSAEASRENIDQVHSGSFVSGMGETGQQTYQTITQGIGYILPSVLLAIGTGGASLGVQATARGVSLGGTMTSAFGSGTSEALNDGADYYKAGASGAVSAVIEGGTEALSFGVGKLVGKVLGKTVSYGTRINGAQFVKGLSKLTAGELGKAALEEGTEELIAELLSPLAKSVYKGGEAFNEYANPELYKQAVIAFAGGAVGGMFGAGVQGTNARIKYGKDGVKALEIISDISQMKQDNVAEFKRGSKADQSTIGQVETMTGEKVKELVSTLDTLKQNDIKSFNNVMEAIKNPNQAIADLEKMKGAKLTADEKIEFKNKYVNNIDSVVKQFQSSTADIVAGQTSSNLTKINGKPTLIQFAKNNEFNQEQHKGSRAFLATDKSGRQLVLINPKYKSNYYQIVAHEAISHGILDTNEHNRNEVIKIIEKDGKLSKEYAKYDSEILDVYQPEISKELGRKVDEKLYKERAMQTEVFKREKLARFLESLVHDDKSLNRLLGNEISSLEKGRIKSILNRIKNSLSLSKDAKLIKQINKVVSEITDSQKETSKVELAPAYSKTKDSIGNQLSPKQQEYFKDSVVRDENGNLKVVYHGTKADFNTFLHKHISDSTGSMDFGYGFYFTDSEKVASGYGTTKSVYLDIKKPLSYDTKTITKTDLSKLLKAVDPDGEMGILSNFDDVSYIGYQRLLSKAINMLYDNNSNDVDIISEMINIDGGYRASKEFYNILKDTLGYDGIITKYHTKRDDVYVVFNSNQIKSIDNESPTDSDDIRYSRTYDSVQASKDYAQHMQERVINMTTTKDVYNIMIDGIASAFGVDIKITNKEVLARQTTIAFNTLLNKPKELNKVVDGIINDILDSKIEYEVKANENQVAITLKDTLRKHLSNLGINVNEFFNDSVSILKDILLDKSNDSKVEKLRNYFQSKIAVLVKLVKQYRNNSYYIVKSFQVHKKINERLKKNKLPRQVGDRHIAELEFYYQATKNIKLSRSAKGISPASIDSIIDGLRGYSPDIAEKLQWLQFNKEIDDARNLLMSIQVNGKFPNRALTLEENIAVYTIMTNIAKDMKMLESETVAQRHKAVEIADEEVKVIAEANKGFKSNVIQNELDAASSVDTIIGRYFGMSSDTYKIMYEDMFNAYNNQLLKQWEFLGEYEKIKEQHKLKDHHFAKRVEFKGSKLSLDILLDMYIQSRTPSGLATLQQGGYSIYEKGNTTHLRLSPQDIITLETMIPSDMRVFGEQVLQDLYNGSIQAYKGDTDERIFGFRNIISETYYPSTKSSSSAKFENENDFKALDPSKTTFNQERLNATKLSLRGMGFSERFKVYTNAITKYGEMTEAIRVFETLTNQFTTREDGTNTTRLTLMAEAIPNFQKYINYYQSQIMGNYVDATKSSSKTFTNIVSFTLAGNLSVVLKQTASIPSIMFEVKFSNWLKAMVGAGGKIAKYGQTKAHLKQISGILAERWGDYNVLKSQVLSNNLSKIAKFFGVPMAKMDEAVIVIFAYSAAEHEAESLGYGKIGTKENENAAIDILNRIVANTQSNAIPIKMSMNRAGANKPIRKFLSYFSSDLQNKVSQINRLLSEAKNAKKQLEIIDNRISKNESAIEENKTKFNEFKKVNNMSGDSTNALAKLDDANAKKFTYFEQEADRLANKQNILKDMKVKKQAIISGGKNAREALKLLFSLFVSGLMISSIEQLMARILGRKGWNENTSGEFAISLLLESTINNLPYVNTITNAIQYKADVGGYDFTLINNMLDFAEDIMTMATNREFELGKIMLNLTHLLGMLTGIPTKNLYNIAMGIWKNVDGSGYQADAIIKGFSDSYMASQFRLAIESNNNKMASGYLDTLLSLYKVGSTNEALQNEMMSLYGDGFNALPKNFMTSYTNEQGKTTELTENQILAFRSVYDNSNKDADGLLSINEYKLATQENKAKSMSKLYDAYYLYAKAKALNLGKADSRLANLLLYTNGNVDIAKYVIYLSKLGTIVETNRKSKKELTLEYINRLSNLTKQEKILLMVLNGYSVGEKLQNQVLSYLSAKGMSRANAMTFLKIGN